MCNGIATKSDQLLKKKELETIRRLSHAWSKVPPEGSPITFMSVTLSFVAGTEQE